MAVQLGCKERIVYDQPRTGESGFIVENKGRFIPMTMTRHRVSSR